MRTCSILADARITTTTELEETLIALLPLDSSRSAYTSNYSGLTRTIELLLSTSERAELFDRTIPWMQRTLLAAPEKFPQPIALLQQGTSGSVRLTQMEACILNIVSFFGLFPLRHRVARSSGHALSESDRSYVSKLPYCNWNNLYTVDVPSGHAKGTLLAQLLHAVLSKARRNGPQPNEY